MPHYKCGTCRTRLQIVRPRPALVVNCPQCGSALDPVADLTKLVGLRRVAFVEDPDRAGSYPGFFDEPASAAMAVLQPRPGP